MQPPYASISLTTYSQGVGDAGFGGASGTLTCTEVDDEHAACHFSSEIVPENTAFPPHFSFDGDFDAPSRCVDGGP